jgi:hypothetical protein
MFEFLFNICFTFIDHGRDRKISPMLPKNLLTHDVGGRDRIFIIVVSIVARDRASCTHGLKILYTHSAPRKDI